MFYRKIAIFFVSWAIFSQGSFQAMAATDASTKDVSVRKLGVAWNMAEDRKMENIGGMYEPEGLDKYMKRYFDQLSAKVDQLIEQSKRLEKKVDELTSKSGRPLVS